VDERETHRGTAAIRAWRLGPASKYRYETEIFTGEAPGVDRFVVSGRITGNFPSPIGRRAPVFGLASRAEDLTRLDPQPTWFASVDSQPRRKPRPPPLR
jgi:hypothetical protein